MKLILLVGLGSFFGGISRYLLSTAIQEKITGDFPYGTLMVNLAGCFAIGCLFGLAEKWQFGIEWRLLLVTGFLGGFTTFSAFSVETFHLWRTGHALMAVTYVSTSVVIGVCLTGVGAWLFRVVPGDVK